MFEKTWFQFNSCFISVWDNRFSVQYLFHMCLKKPDSCSIAVSYLSENPVISSIPVHSLFKSVFSVQQLFDTYLKSAQTCLKIILSTSNSWKTVQNSEKECLNGRVTQLNKITSSVYVVSIIAYRCITGSRINDQTWRLYQFFKHFSQNNLLK